MFTTNYFIKKDIDNLSGEEKQIINPSKNDKNTNSSKKNKVIKSDIYKDLKWTMQNI